MAWKCPDGRFDGVIALMNLRVKPNGVMIITVPALNRQIWLNPRHANLRDPQVGHPVCLIVAAERKWVEPQEALALVAKAA